MHHVSHGQCFVCGLLCFGILCYSLDCDDKEVGLGDGHIGFHCGIGTVCLTIDLIAFGHGEGIGEGALVMFHLSSDGCGVLVIPTFVLWRVLGCDGRSYRIGWPGSIDFG